MQLQEQLSVVHDPDSQQESEQAQSGQPEFPQLHAATNNDVTMTNIAFIFVFLFMVFHGFKKLWPSF